MLKYLAALNTATAEGTDDVAECIAEPTVQDGAATSSYHVLLVRQLRGGIAPPKGLSAAKDAEFLAEECVPVSFKLGLSGLANHLAFDLHGFLVLVVVEGLETG